MFSKSGPRCCTRKVIKYCRCSQTNMRVWLISLLFLSLTGITGCTTVPEARKAASVSVSRFHEEFNSEQYDQIYDESDARFKGTESKKDLTVFLTSIHQKLGKSGNTKEENSLVYTTQGGMIVNLRYQTQFGNTLAHENFTFFVDHDHATLVGYNLQSPEFFEK